VLEGLRAELARAAAAVEAVESQLAEVEAKAAAASDKVRVALLCARRGFGVVGVVGFLHGGVRCRLCLAVCLSTALF